MIPAFVYYFISLTGLLSITAVILCTVWIWAHYNYSYWKRRNIPYLQPDPIFGNFKDLVLWKRDICDFLSRLYNHKNSVNQPAVGIYIFNKPALLIRDLELVKSVLIRDFNSFANRFTSADPHHDSLGANNLFLVKNPNWKQIRSKISPVFTSGKLKQMFPLMDEIAQELDQYLCSLKVDETNKSVVKEVKEICALYATDVIATTAYGIRANSLSNPNGHFRTNGKKIFHFTMMRAVEFTGMFFLPILIKLLRCKLFSADSTIFLRETLNYVIAERIKTGKTRNDLIDLLVSFRKEAELNKDKNQFILEGDALIAQAAIFFSAGFETSSSTMSFALYELAKQPTIQQRLREEIRETLKQNNGEISYDAVYGMKYLYCVVQEVLRHYPPLPFLDRECTAGEEGFSLKPHLDFTIPTGMPVYVPSYALHMDPKFFPNPKAFVPDRFAAENKDNININAYMPFGIGPRNCIGERFGSLQTRIGLISFLRNHSVSMSKESHAEMKLEPRAFIIQAKDGIYLNIIRDPLI